MNFKINKKMNRKGRLGDQVSIISYIFMLVFIVAGIAVGVYIFYGGEYDFKNIEAEILSLRIRECLENKEIKWENFYDICRLNKDVLENNNFIEIDIEGKEVFSVSKGRVEECKFKGAEKNKNYAKCVEREFVKDGKKFNIIAGSIQNSRRVNG